MIPRVWIAVGAVVAVVGYSAIVYHIGGIGPRSDLKVLKVSLAAAQKALEDEDARRKTEHDKLVKEKDRERDDAIAAVNLDWDSYVLGLRRPGGGAGKATEPVRIVAERCDNPAGNDAVSAAVQEFVGEVRAGAARFRDEVAEQLKTCQLQTDALVRAQEWAKREQEINR